MKKIRIVTALLVIVGGVAITQPSVAAGLKDECKFLTVCLY